MTVVLIIIAAVIFTSLGGLFALKYQDKLHLILGFSAGAVLGVALFDILPESLELTKGFYDSRLVMVMLALGFCLFLLADRFFSLHKHDCESDKLTHQSKLSATAFVVHSILDGFGIGLAFKVSPSIGWVVATAVLVHDFSDGINTVGVVIKGKGGRKSAYRWLCVNALAPAVGIVLAFFVTVTMPILGLILAVFTGFFLYISTNDLIPESHHHHPTFPTTLSTVLGLVLVFVLNCII